MGVGVGRMMVRLHGCRWKQLVYCVRCGAVLMSDLCCAVQEAKRPQDQTKALTNEWTDSGAVRSSVRLQSRSQRLKASLLTCCVSSALHVSLWYVVLERDFWLTLFEVAQVQPTDGFVFNLLKSNSQEPSEAERIKAVESFLSKSDARVAHAIVSFAGVLGIVGITWTVSMVCAIALALDL